MYPLTEAATETAQCMGGDVKGKTLEWQMWNTYKHISKLQLAALERGEDPGLVDITTTAKGKSQKPCFLFVILSTSHHGFILSSTIMEA